MSLSQVHAAILNILIGDSQLTALLGGPAIYDAPPTDRRFPFILFGPVSGDDWSCDSDQGKAVTLSFQCWSTNKGRKQIYTLGGRIGEIMGSADFPIMTDDWIIVLAQQLTERYERDWSARATKATLRFRILVERRR